MAWRWSWEAAQRHDVFANSSLPASIPIFARTGNSKVIKESRQRAAWISTLPTKSTKMLFEAIEFSNLIEAVMACSAFQLASGLLCWAVI